MAGTVTVIVPEGTMHVGCVVTVAVGAVGPAGIALITTLADAADVQPVAVSVTV